MAESTNHNPRFDELAEFVTRNGWAIVDRKPIDNAEQVVVSDGVGKVLVDCYRTGSVVVNGKACELKTKLEQWKAQLPPPRLMALRASKRPFIRNTQMWDEERMQCEFKEVKAANPVKAIENQIDEYVVAYLNADLVGSVYFGIRNEDRMIVGVHLVARQRDELQQMVSNKLLSIQPPISPDVFQLIWHPIQADEVSSDPIPDLFVVEVRVSRLRVRELVYYTAGGELIVKTDGGKKTLKGPEMTNFIIDQYIRKH